MTDIFKNLFQQAKHITLKPQEKARIRAALMSYIKTHPVGSAKPVPHEMQKSAFGIMDILRQALRPAAVLPLLALPIIAGAGISLAAEYALPGEILYPVKVDINENIRSNFTLSSESKANWEVERAERRLQEAEKLAAKERLDDDAVANVKSRLAKHMETASNLAGTLESQEKAEAVADTYSYLETTLKTHEKMLRRIGGQKSEAKETVTDLVDAVKASANAATQARTQAEGKISTKADVEVKAAAEAKLQAAENKIAEVETFIKKTNGRATPKAAGEAQVRLTIASEILVQGKANLQNKTYGEAFALSQKAIRIAREAKLLVQTSKNIRIDIGAEASQIREEIESERDNH